MLEPGTIIDGRYEIESYLDGGGYGSVYAATDRKTRRRVAVKVFEGRRDWSITETKQFKIEATVSGILNSEHMVQVSDAGFDLAIHYAFIVMEFLEGKNFQDLIQDPSEGGPLGAAEVVEYLRQVASSLDKAHASTDEAGRLCPILHLDLKPANLYLTHREDGTPLVKILDWGLSKVQSSTGTISREGRWSPQYVASETLRRQRPTPATDTRALGLIAFYLLTGRSYWMSAQTNDGDPDALYKEILDGPSEPASNRARNLGANVELPPAFDKWFAKIVHLDPAQRFQEAGVAIAELALALDTPIRARSLSDSSRTRSEDTVRAVHLSASPGTQSVQQSISGPEGQSAAIASRSLRSVWSSPGVLGILFMAVAIPALVLTARNAGVDERSASSPKATHGAVSAPSPVVSSIPPQPLSSTSQRPDLAGSTRREVPRRLAPVPRASASSTPSAIPTIAPPPGSSLNNNSDGPTLPMSPSVTNADTRPAWQILRAIKPKERHPTASDKAE